MQQGLEGRGTRAGVTNRNVCVCVLLMAEAIPDLTLKLRNKV